ncbi:MAG: hypothetical protein KAW93_00745, partial [Methanogenium sp.]|nr:hypothetical protein [Methanogenium sp.]
MTGLFPKHDLSQNQLFLKTVIYIKYHTISLNGKVYNMKIESQIELLREKIIEDDLARKSKIFIK